MKTFEYERSVLKKLMDEMDCNGNDIKSAKVTKITFSNSYPLDRTLIKQWQFLVIHG